MMPYRAYCAASGRADACVRVCCVRAFCVFTCVHVCARVCMRTCISVRQEEGGLLGLGPWSVKCMLHFVRLQETRGAVGWEGEAEGRGSEGDEALIFSYVC